DRDAPARLVHEAAGRWGTIDIVVNNAALVCNKPVEEIVHEDWDRLLNVNLKAPFFLIQAALPWLRESRGSVINISSINGIRNDNNNLVYDTIKAGLNHMTQGLALDLRTAGIRFNALMPGGVATPLLNQWFRQFT
ncbi:SDR family oxidoreductase, partial [Paenibacillus sepulcri]|nr:SDR family oxidoreductase [Paenibacillus sepulcri]